MTETSPATADTQAPQFPMEPAPGCPFDPPPRYRELQAAGPLFRATLPSGQEAWVVTRRRDVKAVLEDPRFSADPSHPNFPRMFAQAAPQVLKGTFVRMDGAEHLKYRRMLAKEFTPLRAETMRPQILAAVDDHLDRLIAGGAPADLMAGLAYPVPATVICGVLGVPVEDRGVFEASTQVLVNGRSGAQEVQQAKTDILTHLAGVVDAKEKDPGEDLISRLLVEHVATGELEREEVAILAWLLLAAGHHTTATMIGTGTALLLRHPEQLRLLRAEPALLANAVEELLRHQNAMKIGMNRVALVDVEIGGHPVSAGEGVVCQLGMASRDPEAYPDPDRFDVTRSASGHGAFGYGPHLCLGAALARTELQLTLGRLFERLPGLRLAVPLEEVPFWHHNFGIHGVRELPVTW